MGILELIIAFVIGAGGSLTAAGIYEWFKGIRSPSDTQLMLGAINVASQISKRDPKTAQRMLAEMKASLLADAEFRRQDLNGEIDAVIAAEEPSATMFMWLRKYYRKKKANVDERRRRLAEDVKKGRRPRDLG